MKLKKIFEDKLKKIKDVIQIIDNEAEMLGHVRTTHVTMNI